MTKPSTMIALAASFAVALAVFVGMVYAYPALFPYLDASRPSHFAERVQSALDDGDASRAVSIARDAARWQPLNPMVHAVYGNALLAAERYDAAREAFEAALHVPTTPGPGYLVTHKPFYFPPARLALAELAVEEGDRSSALLHIEFAQPYKATRQDNSAAFAGSVYEVYREYEWWARALEYGRPDADARAVLASQSLLRLGWAAMAYGDYGLVDDVAAELSRQETYFEDAALLAGMTAFRREDWAGAEATLFAANGIHDELARYHVTRIPTGEKGSVAADCIWSPLVQLRDSGDSTLLAARIESESLPLGRSSTYRAVQPVAARWSELAAVSPGYFPIRILWKNRNSFLPLHITETSDELTLVEFDDSRLTYEWVRNEVPWLPPSLAGLNVGEMPGWADVARDWYGFRETAASECVLDGDALLLRVTNEDINKMALLYSNPVRCDSRHGFLLRGEVRPGTAPAILGWEALDEQERVVSKGFVFDQVEAESWKEGMVYIEATHFHDRLRIVMGVNRHEGYADFRGIQLLRVTTPRH